MNTDGRGLTELSGRIIGCAFTVSNTLGIGFLEKVYENALAYELRECGLTVQQQHGIPVWYKAAKVGDYIADLVVEQAIMVELKAVRCLDGVHRAQCLNFLAASGLRLCLLLNFGNPKLQIERIVR